MASPAPPRPHSCVAAYLNPKPFALALRHAKQPITMVVGADEPGIGPAIAGHVATLGHHVCLVGVRRADLQELSDEIADASASARIQVGDYVRPRRVRHFVDDMIIHYGRVDNLVYVPVRHAFGGLLSALDEELEQQLETAVWGPWWWMRSLIPTMAAHSGGRLIFLTGASGPGPITGRAAFRAGSAALQALVASAGIEHHSDGVRPVSLIVDGVLDLPDLRDRLPHAVDPRDTITLDQVGKTVKQLLTTTLDDIPHELRIRPKRR